MKSTVFPKLGGLYEQGNRPKKPFRCRIGWHDWWVVRQWTFGDDIVCRRCHKTKHIGVTHG